MFVLTLMIGAVVGLSLGMTGGGGTIFAIPLLVYGLGLPARTAVGVSLAAAGATSFVGFLLCVRSGRVEIRAGLLFAFAGMVGAPLGSKISELLPDALLLSLFSGLMMIIALRLWLQPHGAAMESGSRVRPPAENCRRRPQKDTRAPVLSVRRTGFLMAIGAMTGVLSGLFGVGGGFLIVPALMVFTGMPIHRAIGTSLMVMSLICLTGVISHLQGGQAIPFSLTAQFSLGGVVGMFAGQWVGRRVPGVLLQKWFAIAIFLVATFVIVRNIRG